MTILCEPIGAKIKIPSPLRGPGISAPSRLAALFLVGAIDKTKPATLAGNGFSAPSRI